MASPLEPPSRGARPDSRLVSAGLHSAGASGGYERTLDAVEAAELDDEAVEPGTLVGRYMILDVVGSGGVGVVFAAYDPNLDRKVAIKQLRRSKNEGNSDAVVARRTRLVREAQALARLSHPNVVPVYEVLTHAEQLHVVMEFVDGDTLGDWLSAKKRGWSEIVAMFIQTGRGLAAAHAAQIVHRDFKPENVRVGADERPRVLDFGLASPLRDGDQTHAGESFQDLLERSYDDNWSSDSGSNEVGVTREGQVMGTPAYMPPEQASGGQVDARSDQFSFCVALYEALYGRRPFRGRFDNPRRFRDLSRARVLPGKRPPDLPSEIERALVRGLALLPERRFDSMDELLFELSAVSEGPRRPWWLQLSLMLAAVFVLIAVVALYERARTVESVNCEVGEAMLAEVWDEPTRMQLGAAALSSGKGYAEAVWTRAADSFDLWAKQWSRARVRACEATHVEGSQSPAMLERRMACLDRQLAQVESMSAGLRRQSARPLELLEHLEQLALPSPDSCASLALLEQDSLEPHEGEAQVRALEIRTSLAEIEGLSAVGEHVRAVERGEAALEDALALGFGPVESEAKLILGLALQQQHKQSERNEQLLREAAFSAQRTAHDVVLIRAAAALAALSGAQAQLDAARLWAELARATYERHGTNLDIEAEVRRHLGELALTLGDFQAALGEYERALEIAEQREGERSLAYINALRSIGSTQRELGQFDEALAQLERARELATASFGPGHPVVPEILDALGSAASAHGEADRAIELHLSALELNEQLYGMEHRRVASSLNNLAIIYDETGRYDDAAATLSRAREILFDRLGPEHPDLAFIDVNLGSALQNLGRHGDALVRYEAALSVLEDSLGPEHMAVGVALQNLGSTRWRLGDHAGALADLERSSAVLEASFGHEHPTIGSLELNRARVLAELGRQDEAIAAAREALSVLERALGADHIELVEVLSTLAELELELGNRERAHQYGERAVRLCVGEGLAPSKRAGAYLALARTLEDEQRARQLTLEALEALEGASGVEDTRARVLEWMRAQGIPTP